ncbi:hypothetical protein CPT_MyoSmar_098 [Serratia phage MyoSmar]|jgi:hypothetical protein|uniref:Uncharacterized protein n=2 Tax=Myosmarvirus TaxID=2843428 RepID=A0A9E8G0V3_9CAUD|nr:hypothetical protein HWC56_gp098 [Serratia phage MyoSmar]QEG09547.1 hypothetical protein CPT_MyoSmar_098 [Serratia phage MyoSmar]UZS00397.1 hypothetical protein [Serratia phage SMP]
MRFVLQRHYPDEVSFEDLKPGDTFIHSSAVRGDSTSIFGVLKKSEFVDNGTANAICLNDMEPCLFGSRDKVVRVKCDVHWSVI